jgi:predicted DNA-binding transcriptional regulator AlpA
MDTFGGDDGRILTEKELDAETGLSATTRWRGRRDGWFPAFLELSPGRRGNTVGQIRAWKAGLAARANADRNPEPRGRGRPRKAEADAA